MKVLITTKYNEQCLKELRERFDEVKCMPAKDIRSRKEDEMLEFLSQEKPDALIVELDKVTKNVLEANPNLSFVGVCRANPVNVDVETASKLGIPVLVTPARNAQAVAELVVGQLIMLERNLFDAVPWLKDGSWVENPAYPFFNYKGHEIHGKKVGFIGFGAVARSLWKILNAFGCEGYYYDAFVSDEIDGCKPSSLEDILKNCDIVSVHLPVTPSTKGMITRKLLSLMKADAIFVNSARADVVDYDALYDLLLNKKIRGACIDVYVSEPPSEADYKLIKLENVLATPHIAGAAYEIEDHHSRIMNNAVFEWIDKKQGRCVFNLKDLK